MVTYWRGCNHTRHKQPSWLQWLRLPRPPQEIAECWRGHAISGSHQNHEVDRETDQFPSSQRCLQQEAPNMLQTTCTYFTVAIIVIVTTIIYTVRSRNWNISYKIHKRHTILCTVISRCGGEKYTDLLAVEIHRSCKGRSSQNAQKSSARCP